MLARFIRLREAPQYLGMDRNRFNREVRPYLTEIPIGNQGVAFDRVEMDAWADEYKLKRGKPPRSVMTSRTERRDTRDSGFDEIANKVIQARKKR
jgi:predicted DNA-binding transcriptional regulator AlpA